MQRIRASESATIGSIKQGKCPAKTHENRKECGTKIAPAAGGSKVDRLFGGDSISRDGERTKTIASVKNTGLQCRATVFCEEEGKNDEEVETRKHC